MSKFHVHGFFEMQENIFAASRLRQKRGLVRVVNGYHQAPTPSVCFPYAPFFLFARTQTHIITAQCPTYTGFASVTHPSTSTATSTAHPPLNTHQNNQSSVTIIAKIETPSHSPPPKPCHSSPAEKKSRAARAARASRLRPAARRGSAAGGRDLARKGRSVGCGGLFICCPGFRVPLRRGRLSGCQGVCFFFWATGLQIVYRVCEIFCWCCWCWAVKKSK